MPACLDRHQVDFRCLGEVLIDEDHADVLALGRRGNVARKLLARGGILGVRLWAAEPLRQVTQNRLDRGPAAPGASGHAEWCGHGPRLCTGDDEDDRISVSYTHLRAHETVLDLV